MRRYQARTIRLIRRTRNVVQLVIRTRYLLQPLLILLILHNPSTLKAHRIPNQVTDVLINVTVQRIHAPALGHLLGAEYLDERIFGWNGRRRGS